MENTFSVGEVVKIKRTSGVWEDGEIIEIFHPFGVQVRVKVTDTLKGKPYDGPYKNGYKFIRNEKFGSHLKKYKERVN